MTEATSGTVYGVKNLNTGAIEMVGSTTNSLKARTYGYRSGHKWFREGNYELVALRHISHTEPEFFRCLLHAVENLEIMRNKTWHDLGGRNKMAPVVQYLGQVETQSEIGRRVGRMHVLSGHWASLKSTEHQKSAGRLGGLVRGPIIGPIQGRRNVASGQIQALGREWGRKAVESGQVLELARKNVETGWISRLGAAQGRINSDSGHLKRISHIRWHVRRNIIKDGCGLCQSIQKAA